MVYLMHAGPDPKIPSTIMERVRKWEWSKSLEGNGYIEATPTMFLSGAIESCGKPGHTYPQPTRSLRGPFVGLLGSPSAITVLISIRQALPTMGQA